jgi:hypothetical protein
MRRQYKHTSKQSMIWHPPRGSCLSHTTHSEISGALHTTPCGEAPHKESWRRQTAQRGFKDNTHTSATRHLRQPTRPQHTLTFCAPHSHPLLSTAITFVSYGFVLVRVRVRAPFGGAHTQKITEALSYQGVGLPQCIHR